MAIADEWLKYAPKPRALSGTDRWNVFLSYRSVDRAWVLNLYDVLRELGHKVFLDQTALKPGDQLVKELQDALKTSQAGILVWSSATQDSDWVQREYQALERLATERKGFQFVPVRLDRSEVPLFAQNRIFLDFADYPDGPNGGELLRLLHGIAGVPLREEAARFGAEQDEGAKQAANKIKAAIETGKQTRLNSLFREDGLPWRVSAALGCKAAEGLTKLGSNDEALAMLKEIEVQFPKAIRPKQLRALALARRAVKTKNTDELDEAQGILAELYAAGERDPETLGIYGRTWMDRYELDQDELSLRKSRDLYAEAFDAAHDDYYTGINAAAKSVFLGTPAELGKATEYAARVLDVVGTNPWPNDYWKTATVAEAFLLEKNYPRAAELYRTAVAMSPKETGSHGTSWTQARRLMGKLGATAEEQELVRRAFGSVAQGQ
ncbi:MAG TPA: toll/interleukin-1 receptor domain-containing protein [Opitutaceae bacterium]|nr:toll/interleukin-1 receptor domain-containing protein [Opitutaceae bacterium]